MGYNLQRLETVVAVPAITLADFKEHQVIQHDQDDDLCLRYMQAATDWCENYSNHALNLSRYVMYLDGWCHTPGFDYLALPWAPIRAIEAVRYTDVDGVQQWLDTAAFKSSAYAATGRIRFTGTLPTLESYDGLDQVQIQFIAGYGAYAAVSGYPYDYPKTYADPSAGNGTVPTPLQQAVRLLAGWWYEQRETATIGSVSKDIEYSARALVDQYRILDV